MSEPVTAIAAVAVLFATFGSLVAPVEPFSVEDPAVVGVPLTVQLIPAVGGNEVGGTGEHTDVSPAGNPAIAHDADIAIIAGDDALVHV